MGTEDGTTVQPPATSEGAAAPDQTATVAPPLDESKIAELVKTEVAKATEVAKREIQSVKDKAAEEVRRYAQRASVAETTLRTATERLKVNDPTAATEVELAQFRSEREERERAEAVQAARGQFYGVMRETVEDMGLDPEDKGIDWAPDATNAAAAQKRILTSAARIKREKESQMASQIDEMKKLQDEIKKLKAQISGEVDSVDTSTPGTTNVKGIPTDITKFREWIAKNPDEYRKRRAEVLEMQRKGLIR